MGLSHQLDWRYVAKNYQDPDVGGLSLHWSL